MGFLQEFCHLMKKDIIDMFQELPEAGSFIKSLNSSFSMLITEIGGTHNIKDFRLMSLVDCIIN